jgi:hypothetical protein
MVEVEVQVKEDFVLLYDIVSITIVVFLWKW